MSVEQNDSPILDFELEEKLARIRVQINSKLENQKQLLVILSAVEENIEEQNNKKTNITYLLSFLLLLDQSSQGSEQLNSELLVPVLYFLDIIFPFTPRQLLKSKFSDILTRIAPILTNDGAEAPLIKSCIGCIESLLLAQDHASWTNRSMSITPNRGLIGLLEFSVDPRPKVRKRAHEAIHSILSHPPASPSLEHVASKMCSEYALKAILVLLDEKLNNKKNQDINSKIIHNLQLVESITSANAWPQLQIEALCDLLLEISKTNDQFLVQTSFQCFESLFSTMTNELQDDKFQNVLKIIFDLQPSINDSKLAASWLLVVAKAVTAYAKVEPLKCLTQIPKILNTLKLFFASEVSNITTSVSQCFIAIIIDAVGDDLLLLPPLVPNETYEETDEVISSIAELFNNELLSLRYSHCFKDILEVLNVIFKKFQTRCNPDFLQSLEIVGEWRSNEQQDFKEELELVIGSAIRSLGPDVVLSIIPLNLDKSTGGRAWLLPILRDNIINSEISIFKKQFVPLLKLMTERLAKTPSKNVVVLKIFETVIDQIWSLLPKFCYLAKDVRESFDDEFAMEISDMLYSKVELRVTLCNSLKNLVESNLSYIAEDQDKSMLQQFPKSSAEESIKYLQSKSSKLLSVLFNVFTSTLPESRGFVMETIDVYLQIIPKDELETTFNKVCGLLNDALQKQVEEKNKLTVTLMDLIVGMTKYVPESSYLALFNIFNQTVSNDDALVQKRAYRILTRLSEVDSGKEATLQFIGDIEKLLIQSSETCLGASKAARLSCILAIIKIIPSTDLYLIPSLVSEIILSTKVVNEKTRGLAYEVLIEMGNRMYQGGVIDNSKIPGLENVEPTEASLQKFFEICSPGLAGATPHMISATITCFSCLFHEFHSKMDEAQLLEMYQFIELFLTQRNREIVKSAIGFVKVAILSLPESLILPNIKDLLAKLMVWSHEHKGHFKSKVKHIIERMIRKFGYDVIESNIPEEDMKLITNIKKSKQRAKRKQLEAVAEEKKHGNFADAFDEAIYGSDSEDEENESSDDEGGNKVSRQYIKESKDTPLDLLDRQQLAQITSSKPKKVNRSHKDNFKTLNGKLVIRDTDEEDPLLGKDSGINAYLEAVKNGPVRGQKNRLKYKKQRDDDEDFSDDDQETVKKPQHKVKNGRISKPQRKPQQKFKARKKF